MFFKLAMFTAASMAVFVAAAPSGIQNSCNTGPVQCCNSVVSSNHPSVTDLWALLGLNVSDLTGQVGMNCSPITAIGAGSGSSCTSQPVCCDNNNFNGLVAVGCSPLNLNL
ncbi:hydrophobin-251 [Pholiota molesta]|nr:hydrophobin-251 [Pholiota molesta]